MAFISTHFLLHACCRIYNKKKDVRYTDLAYTLQVGVSPGDVRFSNTEHVHCSLVKPDEHTVVDLTQSEQLENFADLKIKNR